MKKSLSLSLLLVFSISMIYAQSSKKEEKEKLKDEQYSQIVAFTDAKRFEFVGARANPRKGPQVDLTNRQNFVKIEDDNAIGSMSYFGRAYSGGYSSSDAGIKFDAEMEEYDVQKNDKKRKVTIKFKAKGVDDTYSCTMTISSIQSVSLSITCNKKQPIYYTGYLKELSEE